MVTAHLSCSEEVEGQYPPPKNLGWSVTWPCEDCNEGDTTHVQYMTLRLQR